MDDFFIRYAERKLGRSLTEDEQVDIEGLINRRQIRDWVKSITENPKPKPKRKYRKKERSKDEQSVTNSKSEEE